MKPFTLLLILCLSQIVITKDQHGGKGKEIAKGDSSASSGQGKEKAKGDPSLSHGKGIKIVESGSSSNENLRKNYRDKKTLKNYSKSSQGKGKEKLESDPSESRDKGKKIANRDPSPSHGKGIRITESASSSNENQRKRSRVKETAEKSSSESDIEPSWYENSPKFGTFEEAKLLIAEVALPEELFNFHVTTDNELRDEMKRLHDEYYENLEKRKPLSKEQREESEKEFIRMHAKTLKKLKEIARRRKVKKNFKDFQK